MNKSIANENRIMVLVFALLFLFCAVGVFFGSSYNDKTVTFAGEGTKELPYKLDRKGFSKLDKALRLGDSFCGVWFEIDDDCDLSGINLPIGGNGTEFGGIINGNGHQLLLDDTSADRDIALFDNISGTIYNLVISKESVVLCSDEEGRYYAAGIAVHVLPNGKILNCQNLGKVIGKREAGIAGLNDGVIINCATFANPDEEGAKKLVRTKGKGRIENCYTAKGGCFELWNLASDEVNNYVTSMGCNALNERIKGLLKEYPDYDFCIWENGEYWPRPVLGTTYAKEENSDEIVIYEHITKPGEYHFSGKIDGQILIDLPKENNDLVSIVLDNATIENDKGPAILALAPYEIDDDADPYVEIVLADKSDNYISGAPYLDIYSEEHKNEGAISSDDAIAFRGNGKLTVNGKLEGIEAKNRIVFESGEYEINSVDDGLAADLLIDIEGGKFNLMAGDDCIDSNGEVYINNARVYGATSTEQLVNAHKDFILNNTTLMGITALGCKDSTSDSMQIISVDNGDDDFKTGDFIVATDEEDVPIAAYEIIKDSKVFCIAMPKTQGKKCKFYLANKVEGEFLDNVCLDVEDFEIVKSLKEE